MCWPLVTVQNGILCYGTTVRIYHNWSAIEENMLLGVPKSDWLVSVDGVNECISIMVQNS